MNEIVKTKLAEIVKRYGASIIEDASRTKAILMDLLKNENRKEINILITAIEEGIPQELSSDNIPVQILMPKLINKLKDNRAMENSYAEWAVQTWAYALGIYNNVEAQRIVIALENLIEKYKKDISDNLKDTKEIYCDFTQGFYELSSAYYKLVDINLKYQEKYNELRNIYNFILEEQEKIDQENEKYERRRVYDSLNTIIAINFGINSVIVSALQNGKPEVIKDNSNNDALPSVISFINENEIMIGQKAKEQMNLYPENTVFSILRLMGVKYSSVKNYLKKLPYKCIEGKDDSILIEIRGKKITPEEICSMIFREVKQNTEAYLEGKITKVVLSVPAFFSIAQMRAIYTACDMIGLQILRILSESLACAIDYYYDKSELEELDERTLVIIIGDGIVEASVLEVSDGIVFEVKSICNNINFGTKDLFKEAFYLIEQAITDAFLSKGEIDKVLLIGNSVKNSGFIDILKGYFKTNTKIIIGHEKSISKGLCIRGGILNGKIKNILPLDVTPYDFGIETLGGFFSVVIKKNTTIPTSMSQVLCILSNNNLSQARKKELNEYPIIFALDPNNVEIKVFYGQNTSDYKIVQNINFEIPSLNKIPYLLVTITFHIDANGIVSVLIENSENNINISSEILSWYGKSINSDKIEKFRENIENYKILL